MKRWVLNGSDEERTTAVRFGADAAQLIVAGALLFACIGCAPRAGVTVHQSFAPAGQRNLSLQHNRTHVSSSPDARTIVATFSRPDADTPSRDFVLYIVMPPNDGEWVIDSESTAAARGFLIQTSGSLRGKTALVGGSVIMRRALWPRTNDYRIDLALRCADETRIVGELIASEAPYEALLIERRYAADVIELTGRTVSDDSEPLPEPTPPRATGDAN